MTLPGLTIDWYKINKNVADNLLVVHINKIDMREGGGPATLKIAKYDTPDDLFKNAFVRDIYSRVGLS